MSQEQLSAKEQEIKAKALEVTLKNLHKKYGKESINIMKNVKTSDIKVDTTGSLALDKALGVGGLPVGRIIEIYGPESSGKTTLALGVLAKAQALGKNCAFIDVEQAMSLPYAKGLGVDTDNLIFAQPSSGEEVLDITETLCNGGGVDLIVIDSVAAMQTKAEIEGDIGDAHIGQVARLMSSSLKKIVPAAAKTNTTVIFINQIRDKIGVMGYGEKTTTPGGNALKFFCSVRIDVRRIATIKEGEIPVGNKVKFTIKKNKVAAPFQVAEAEIYFGKGISKFSEVIDLGIKYDIIEKNGAWFSYGERKIGQGKKSVRELFENDPEFFDDIEKQVLAKFYPPLEEEKLEDKKEAKKTK